MICYTDKTKRYCLAWLWEVHVEVSAEQRIITVENWLESLMLGKKEISSWHENARTSLKK